MPRLTGPEKKARAAFDVLMQRHQALERHAARLQRDLAGEMAFGNFDNVQLLRHSLDSAHNELLALAPRLRNAMRDNERSKPAYLLPQPARPAIVITKPMKPVVDLTRRGRNFDAAGRVRPKDPWHVKDAAEWNRVCKALVPRR